MKRLALAATLIVLLAILFSADAASPQNGGSGSIAYGVCIKEMGWKVRLTSDLDASPRQVWDLPCETKFEVTGPTIRWRVPVRTTDTNVSGYIVENMLQSTPSARKSEPLPVPAPMQKQTKQEKQADKYAAKATAVCKEHPTFTMEECASVALHIITRGMSSDAVIAAWGRPIRSVRDVDASGESFHWTYLRNCPYWQYALSICGSDWDVYAIVDIGTDGRVAHFKIIQ